MSVDINPNEEYKNKYIDLWIEKSAESDKLLFVVSSAAVGFLLNFAVNHSEMLKCHSTFKLSIIAFFLVIALYIFNLHFEKKYLSMLIEESNEKNFWNRTLQTLDWIRMIVFLIASGSCFLFFWPIL